MKKIIFLAVISFTAVSTTFAQDNSESNPLQQVLQSYYNIKNALVAGNKQSAADNATAFIKNLENISENVIAEGSVKSLLEDAGTIADAKNIDKQRVVFSNFSTNMMAVAKEVKLTTDPIYVQYCPMKKASWLSSEKGVKNPYYGSSMLTCGKVAETIQ